MHPVYTTSFFSNKKKIKDYESDYLLAIKKQKVLYNKIKQCAQTGVKRIHRKYSGQYFPKDIDELLILSPKKIAEIYIFYKDPVNIKFRKDVDGIFRYQEIDKNTGVKLFKTTKNGKKIPVIYDCLDYIKYSEKTIIPFFIDHDDPEILESNTCTYCDMVYTSVFYYSREKKVSVNSSLVNKFY